MRYAKWLSVASALSWMVLVGGPGCTVGGDPGTIRGQEDMAGGTGSTADMAAVMEKPIADGEIGAACKANGDCRGGTSPACWTRNLADEPGNLGTPGGYCTSTCATDGDCQGKGICTPVGVGGSKYCLASCRSTTRCRHDDYACFVLSSTSGYCFPAGKLNCNPTANAGKCVSPDGACIRRAFEDRGECREICSRLGIKTCNILPNGDIQHCIYVDASRDIKGQMTRDLYQGLACFKLYSDAKSEGTACSYYDECQDGLECNLNTADKKCRSLCVVGVQGGCSDPMQQCKDVFSAGPGKPGLCTPS